MGLEALADRGVQTISGGERQKAYLAMALAQDTPYIALDEPATYLDLAVQKEILRLLARLKDKGKCIIAVMHDLGSALEVSDHICLLDGGEVIAYAPPEQLVKSGLIEQVFGVECIQVPGKRGSLYLFA
jgi:iron complex transport system ATP-binding protein